MSSNPEAGVYSCLYFSKRTNERLRKWCIDTGIPKDKIKKDFHITISYSVKPVFYTALGLLPPLPVKPKNLSLFGKKNDYLVLEVDSALARNRFEYGQLLGAVTDFPDYKPHVSLAQDVNIDVSKLKPPDFTLFLYKEEVTELNPDFSSDKAVTDPKIVKRIMQYYKDLNKAK